MTREIKFRGYLKGDEGFGIMSYGVMPTDTTFKVWMADLYGNNILDGDFNIGEDIEIMQYTGLSDRNGKEIYEGDVVEWNRELFEVIWDGFMFNAKDFYDSSSDYPTIAFSECVFEVVGNIHENPELIGGADNE